MNNDAFDTDDFEPDDTGDLYGAEEFSSKTQLKQASED